MKRSVQVFAAVFCIAAMLSLVLPVPFFWYWGAVFVIAVIAAAVAGAGVSGGAGGGGRRGDFLCDSCKYDNERDCYRPDRPNATRCPDYKRRGS